MENRGLVVHNYYPMANRGILDRMQIIRPRNE